MFRRRRKGELADILGAHTRLLHFREQLFNRHVGHGGFGLHGQGRLKFGGGSPSLRCVCLVNDDPEALVLEGLLRQDGLHRIREGLDGDHDDWGAFEQSLGQLFAFRFRSLLAVNGCNEPFLVVQLLNGILKLAIQDRAVCDDDDSIKNSLPIVIAELH